MAVDIGIIQTVVGTGKPGYAGDGGPATQAVIGEAYGCDFDSAGNLYISDGRNHTIRRIDKNTGIITTVAGCGRQGWRRWSGHPGHAG
jgi:DNA-binding beta-propeller fold protein YncE